MEVMDFCKKNKYLRLSLKIKKALISALCLVYYMRVKAAIRRPILPDIHYSELLQLPFSQQIHVHALSLSQ